LARALDLLGERWTILLLRELAMGPRRYKDLLESLTGIGTNLLAARLKMLVSAGVIAPVVLPPPASVRAYELTAFGEQLRPILSQLAVWGLQLAMPADDDVESRGSWTMLAMVTIADPDKVAALNAVVELRIGDEVMWVLADETGVQLRSGAAAIGPDLVISTDVQTFSALGEGALSPTQAAKAGTVEVCGDRKLLTRFFQTFRIPRRAAA
jgi:DNA-binding HxlR family transcriptional regulator/putative sterol carrier protein